MKSERIMPDYMSLASDNESNGEFNFNSWLLNYIDTHM